MRESTASITRWADETFGPAPSLFRLAARANEEMAELLRAISSGKPAEPVNRDFFAAMFRAATQSMTMGEAEALLKKERERIADNNRETIDREVKRMTQDNLEEANCWRRLIAAIGENKWSADDKQLIEAYRIIKSAGLLTSHYNSLHTLAQTLEAAAKRVREAMAPIIGERAAE